MKNIRHCLLVVLGIFLFSGCAVKEYRTSEPKLVTLKTKLLRFNDVGFIRRAGDAVQAELFSAGQAVERIEVNHLVCVTAGCMGKSAFNTDYLYAGYPDDLLQNVLTGRPVFGGAGRVATADGFEQQLAGEGYDILYRVGAGQISFKDRANNILIRIRDLPETRQ